MLNHLQDINSETFLAWNITLGTNGWENFCLLENSFVGQLSSRKLLTIVLVLMVTTRLCRSAVLVLYIIISRTRWSWGMYIFTFFCYLHKVQVLRYKYALQPLWAKELRSRERLQYDKKARLQIYIYYIAWYLYSASILYSLKFPVRWCSSFVALQVLRDKESCSYFTIKKRMHRRRW